MKYDAGNAVMLAGGSELFNWGGPGNMRWVPHPLNPAVPCFAAWFSSSAGRHFSNIYARQGNGMMQPRIGTSTSESQEMKPMKTRSTAITVLGAMLVLALAVPVMADESAPADAMVTTSVPQAESPAFDPVGSFMGMLSLRQEIRERQAENRNLSQDIRENQQEIHGNWWENTALFENILGNREAARSAQQDELALRRENLGHREEIRNTRLDMQDNPDNRSAGREEIAADKDVIRQNWQEINATRSIIHDQRNLIRENRSVIRQNNQEDIDLRQENNVSWSEIRTNHEQNREDRQQIRNISRNGSSGGSS